VRLTKEALKEGRILNNLNVMTDGVQALSYLHRESPYEEATRPDIILLDLNLPLKDGKQVLKEIKDDESLKRIPVVILTTSEDERDIHTMYGLHANCYVRKPVELDEFISVIKAIDDFWLTIVKLPR
jgi:two-component system, chemotaxis family, response regulator Rcp1